MSIVKALNELSGKEANTIEKAIRNIELGGGGGGKFVVHFTTDPQTREISADKTIEEIIEAKNSGKDVIGDVESMYTMPLEQAFEDGNGKFASFQKVLINVNDERIRSIGLLTIVMTKYEGVDTEIEVQQPYQELISPPLSVRFSGNERTGTYSCLADKNEVASAILNRDPINATLYIGGKNMNLNYCTDGHGNMQFYWITYSTSMLTFHSLSSDMDDESGWEYFEKTITFDA